uniref:Uncharacterized protein n=1 Tax=Siphoviridae sp. ctX581 TaxID=2826365 RepID=A0A8S5MDN2_9CAUD|nr:MAG TPA: hypothetical protein [Siphoviridae sp. ctX581]DAX31947.1 MAG TPA: hypothetical protein [Caudoviricetes sp.]
MTDKKFTMYIFVNCKNVVISTLLTMYSNIYCR